MAELKTKEIERADPIDLFSQLDDVKHILTLLEGKMDEMYMRPRMPYSQGASTGDTLKLDVDLKPEWV